MKCIECDKILSDREAVCKDEDGHYLDLCDECFYHDNEPSELIFVYLEENKHEKTFKIYS